MYCIAVPNWVEMMGSGVVALIGKGKVAWAGSCWLQAVADLLRKLLLPLDGSGGEEPNRV